MYLRLCTPCGVAAVPMACHATVGQTHLLPVLAVLLQQPSTVQVCALEESSWHVVGMKNQEQTLAEFRQVGKLISV